MTKREANRIYRQQELKAVQLYNKGRTLKQIKKVCPMVPSWMVSGLTIATGLQGYVDRATRRARR